MDDDQIREAARAAFNGASGGTLIHTDIMTEGELQCLDAVYRAWLAAGRAEADQARQVAPTNANC